VTSGMHSIIAASSDDGLPRVYMALKVFKLSRATNPWGGRADTLFSENALSSHAPET
jgi:hypothetical protein